MIVVSKDIYSMEPELISVASSLTLLAKNLLKVGIFIILISGIPGACE